MAKITTTNIPKEVLEFLESAPDTGYNAKHRDWEPWEDEILITFYRIKSSNDLSRALKMAGSVRGRKSIQNRVENLKGKGVIFAYEEE